MTSNPIASTVEQLAYWFGKGSRQLDETIQQIGYTANQLWNAGVRGVQEAYDYKNQQIIPIPPGYDAPDINPPYVHQDPVVTPTTDDPDPNERTPRSYYGYSWYQGHFPGIYNQLGGSTFNAFQEWINYYKQGQSASTALRNTMEGEAYQQYLRSLNATNWSDGDETNEPDPGGNINITTPTIDLSGLGLADLISAQPNMEDINTLIDTIVSSGKETTEVGTSIPEPVFAQPQLSPVEMLAFKTKSKRLWSLRQLPLDQITEIYQSIYDTLFTMLQKQKGQTHYGNSIQRSKRSMETSQRRPYRQRR